MKIAIGYDPNAKDLAETTKKHLTALGYDWEAVSSQIPP